MARKLTIPQRKEAKVVVAEYYRKGYSSYRIAKVVTENTGVSISQPTALALINEVVADLKKLYEGKIDALFWANLDHYNGLEAEMWEAWELSKTQRRKTTSRRKGEAVNNPQNITVRSVKTKEVSDSEELTDGRGDPRYAAIILDCINNRMQWLGKLKFGADPVPTGNVVNNTDNSVTLVINTPLSPKMQALQAAVKTIQVEPQENGEN